MIVQESLKYGLLGAAAGEQLKVVVRKAINVAAYETETIEMETTVVVQRNLAGVERMALLQILTVQLDYALWLNALHKRIIKKEQYDARMVGLRDCWVRMEKDLLETLGITPENLMTAVQRVS